MRRKFSLVCGIASSALYIAVDVLGTLRYRGYSYADQTYSELLAVGSPVRPLMLALSAIPYTVLMSAFAAGVWTSAAPKRAARITGALLAAYAVAGTTGIFFPMNTREALASGEAGLRNSLHPTGTALMSLFFVLAMTFGARLLGKQFRYYTYGSIAALVVSGVLTSRQTGQMVANLPTPWMGIEERTNIYTAMLWIAALALGLLRVRTE